MPARRSRRLRRGRRLEPVIGAGVACGCSGCPLGGGVVTGSAGLAGGSAGIGVGSVGVGVGSVGVGAGSVGRGIGSAGVAGLCGCSAAAAAAASTRAMSRCKQL
jgi:hypothetical protein